MAVSFVIAEYTPNGDILKPPGFVQMLHSNAEVVHPKLSNTQKEMQHVLILNVFGAQTFEQQQATPLVHVADLAHK
jgi:hypothetical protein